MLITLSGLDGAGKTTLIRWLEGELARRGRRATVLHLNDHVSVYAVLRSLRDALLRRPAVDAPPRMEPHATGLGRLRDAVLWSKPLRRWLFPVDLLLFLGHRLVHEGIRRRVLVMDRYFYDTLVDVAGAHGWRWLRLLARLTPQPDLPVYLDLSAAEAYARKGEYTEAYLRQRELAYRRVLAWSPAVLSLPARDLDAARTALGRALDQRQLRSALPEGAHADHALRLLLDDPRLDPDDVDWSVLRRVAERHTVLVRLGDRVVRRGESLPEPTAAAVARARVRAQHTLDLVTRVGEVLDRQGVDHVFLNTGQHYPDVGRDVDVLVAADHNLDRALHAELGAVPRARRLADQLAGARTYAVPGVNAMLDVHVGRLGRVGEHSALAALLLARRQQVRLGRCRCAVPRREEQLLLQSLHLVGGRRALRVADAFWTITAVREQRVDWDDVLATARAHALLASLSGYLRYIDQLYGRLFGQALFTPDLLSRLASRVRGRLEYRQGAYRFPATRVGGRLYLEQLRAGLRAGRWLSAARHLLLPLAAANAAWHRLTPTLFREP